MDLQESDIRLTRLVSPALSKVKWLYVWDR